MMHFVMAFVGFAGGALLVFLLLDRARRQWRELSSVREQVDKTSADLRTRREALERDAAQLESVVRAKTSIQRDELDAARESLQREREKRRRASDESRHGVLLHRPHAKLFTWRDLVNATRAEPRAKGMVPPLVFSEKNHGGLDAQVFQTWDGKSWKTISGWIPPRFWKSRRF